MMTALVGLLALVVGWFVRGVSMHDHVATLQGRIEDAQGELEFAQSRGRADELEIHVLRAELDRIKQTRHNAGVQAARTRKARAGGVLVEGTLINDTESAGAPTGRLFDGAFTEGA